MTPRNEGPTKVERIDDLQYTFDDISVKIGVPTFKVERGMWYNLDRKTLELLIAYLESIGRTVHAVDSPGRVSSHQESLNTEPTGSVGHDRE